MKELRIFIIICLLFVGFSNAINVRELLNKLKIEDKCGQMTQVQFGLILKEPSENEPLTETTIDREKLKIALKDYKIGSILGGPAEIQAHFWHKMIRTIQDFALNETDFRIPIIYGTDSIHGAFIDNAVLFPQPLSMAATFNKDLVGKIAHVIAKETRAIGIPWNFSPILDIGRQPLWPRLYETFGEDVCLASQMANAFVTSHQGSNFKDRKTAANCLKHYVGYSLPFNGRDRSVAWIPENMLREYFLPSFESGVRSGAMTVMINSGDVNGIPGHANYHYLTTILKGEFNLTGFTVSDYEDIIRLHTRDKVARTPEEAVYKAVMAGVDMSMVPNDYSFYNHCVSLAYKDIEFRKRIDDAAYRILHVKNELGLFDDPYPHAEDIANIGTDESEDLNLEAARQSIILAKNLNKRLPLNTNTKLLITGPTGNLVHVMNSGWSYSWQGNHNNNLKNRQFVIHSI